MVSTPARFLSSGLYMWGDLKPLVYATPFGKEKYFTIAVWIGNILDIFEWM
jgi:hypothetical protein